MKVGKNTQVGWAHYFEPTPKNIQKFADALVALSLSITGFSVIMEAKWVAIAFIIIGGIGQFGQKFFKNGT